MIAKLKLPKEEAKNLIDKLISIAWLNIDEYQQGEHKEIFKENFKNWIEKSKSILSKIFPRKTEIRRFESAWINFIPLPFMQPQYSIDDYKKKIIALESLKRSLEYYSEPNEIPTKISKKIDIQFNFIKDKFLQKILRRDYQELKASLDNKSVKSILIISGSILEAILLDKALVNKDKIGKLEKKILEMNLDQLKDELATIDIAYKEVNAILDYIKDYRNLAHPGKEKRGEFKINEKDALAVFHNIEAIIERFSQI